MDSKCDVLILTSSFGMGHNSAAKAIREQLEDENPDISIRIVDMLDISNPRTKKAFVDFYRAITRKQPKIYNVFYNIRRDFRSNILDEFMYNIYLKRAGRFIMSVDPKLIISTFPLCSGFVSRVKEKYGLEIPLATSITDVVGSWEWIHTNTNMYFVPCRVVKDKLMDKGIPKDKIRVTGIPVQKQFMMSGGTNREYRQLLIMGGALSNTEKTVRLLEKMNSLSGIKTVVVTAGDASLYGMLSRNVKLDNVEILDYTTEMARFMDESDIIFAKPGGATLFEAINKGIPLVLRNTKVGQEEENLRFVASKGIGILIDDEDSIEAIVLQSLEEPGYLDAMKRNIEEIKGEMRQKDIGIYATEVFSSK
jgi:processive 1,2-diacylglycerol beta-glucosyltransferase